MSDLAFKLLEGNSDIFNLDIFTELKNHNITEFSTQENSSELLFNYDYDSSIPIYKPSVRFFSDNLSTDSFNVSLELLIKILKKLPKFELLIETPNESFTINERNDLNEIFEKNFKDYSIYNRETNSYILYQAKDLNKNKSNKSIKIFDDDFKETELLKNTDQEIQTENILLSRIQNIESKIKIIKKESIIHYLRHYHKLIDLLEEIVIEAKIKLGDDSVLKLSLNTNDNIEYEFLVLSVGNPNKNKQEVFELVEDLLNSCANRLINIQGSMIVKPGYRSKMLTN